MTMKDLVTVTPEGLIWPINGDVTYDWLSRETKEQGGHLSVLSKYLKKMNVMIQAGGNCGLTLIPFMDKFDRIYTFEPDPLNFYCLVNNLSKKNVYKVQGCLGEDNRMVDMVNPCSNNDVGGYHVGSSVGTIPKFKIDDLQLEKCDLIMLDIEGYEYNALLGGVQTIAKYRPVVCVECCSWLSRFGASTQHIDTLLARFGYKYMESYFQDRIYVSTVND